jgi:hypothetical protein
MEKWKIRDNTYMAKHALGDLEYEGNKVEEIGEALESLALEHLKFTAEMVYI